MHEPKVTIPAAYRLADAQRPRLLSSFESFRTNLRQLGCDVQLNEFVGFVEEGRESKIQWQMGIRHKVRIPAGEASL
jgi:hypothetical protein